MHSTFLSRRGCGSVPLPSVSGQDSEVACRVARRSRTFSKRQRTNRRDVEQTSPRNETGLLAEDPPSRHAIAGSYLEIP